VTVVIVMLTAESKFYISVAGSTCAYLDISPLNKFVLHHQVLLSLQRG